MNFDYTLEPGKKLKNKNYILDKEPIISIITPFYNSGNYIEQTANSVLNQTFPYFEWIIIDDGSTDKNSLLKLEEISKKDSRIKILHKENTGAAHTRDFGANNSSSSSKYLVFLDDDDLIINTYLECAYLTLEVNANASWAYTDVVNFSGEQYLWTKLFDSDMEKKDNILVATAMIRKSDFLKIGGYDLQDNDIYEDWNLWLKFLAQGMFPVRMNFHGFWYRRKNSNESKLYRDNQNKEKALTVINETKKQIKQKVSGIQYPMQDYKWEQIAEFDNIIVPTCKQNNKTNILFIIPWMTMGGADKFNLDLINGLDESKFEVTIISTEPNVHAWKQQFEESAYAIYDLTTFLPRKYWPAFINYIIKKHNINIILNSNSTFGYATLPYIKSCYPEIPILDYIHMEEWYNRNGGFSRDSSGVESVIDKTLLCNENSRQILINHFGRSPEELETVYIGVDEKKFNPDNYNIEDLKLKYNIENDKKIISFIARIDIQKRPYLLVEIIKKLYAERNDFIILIAGDGPLLKPIKKLIEKYNLKNSVRFLGAVSNTSEIYAVSDITLNCSIKEGLALTAYESLSMGIPVVSADVGGQKELINDSVGVIVPCLQAEEDILVFDYSDEESEQYVDALNKVMNNLDFYKSNARSRILNGFTIDHMISRMSDILAFTANNPDQRKIDHGKELHANQNILKEFITHYFIAHSNDYIWLCNQTVESSVDQECAIKIPVPVDYSDASKKSKLCKFLMKLHIYDICKQLYYLLKLTYSYVKNIIVSTFVYIKNLLLGILDFFKIIGRKFKNIKGRWKNEK